MESVETRPRAYISSNESNTSHSNVLYTPSVSSDGPSAPGHAGQHGPERESPVEDLQKILEIQNRLRST